MDDCCELAYYIPSCRQITSVEHKQIPDVWLNIAFHIDEIFFSFIYNFCLYQNLFCFVYNVNKDSLMLKITDIYCLFCSDKVQQHMANGVERMLALGINNFLSTYDQATRHRNTETECMVRH